MSIIRNKFILVPILLLLIIAIFISFMTKNTEAKKIEQISGDITVSYNNPTELFNASDLILEIDISQNKFFTYQEVPFTLSIAKVTKVYKGAIDKKDSIKILETGGIINNTEYYFEGNPVLKEKEKALVYLVKYDGPINDDCYVIRGVYQGKFKKENNKIIPSKNVNNGLKNIKSIQEFGLTEKN
jgi:hypothetical protein